MSKPKILVIGDLILDKAVYGTVERVCPEAPVPVLVPSGVSDAPGGAGAAAMLATGLGADVSVLGVIGIGEPGMELKWCLEQTAEHVCAVREDQRRTTVKTRFLGCSGGGRQQLLRVDNEVTTPIAEATVKLLVTEYEKQLDVVDVVVVSDYLKGTLTLGVLTAVITAAKDRGIPVIVDPGRLDDFSRYDGATILKPNRSEALAAWGGGDIERGHPLDAIDATGSIRRETACENVVITLGEDGVVWATENNAGHVAADPVDPCDVTGAGDMFAAALAVNYHLPIAENVRMANIAAGLQVQKMGIQQISPEELKAALIEDSVAV